MSASILGCADVPERAQGGCEKAPLSCYVLIVLELETGSGNTWNFPKI